MIFVIIIKFYEFISQPHPSYEPSLGNTLYNELDTFHLSPPKICRDFKDLKLE